MENIINMIKELRSNANIVEDVFAKKHLSTTIIEFKEQDTEVSIEVGVVKNTSGEEYFHLEVLVADYFEEENDYGEMAFNPHYENRHIVIKPYSSEMIAFNNICGLNKSLDIEVIKVLSVISSICNRKLTMHKVGIPYLTIDGKNILFLDIKQII